MSRYVIGIDLGTTNCAVGYAELPTRPDERPQIQMLRLPQLTAPGEIAARPTLPSFLYLPAAAEFAAEALRLPWGGPGWIAGELARTHGPKVPTRLVSSAKSWLCNPAVDRTAAILPWQAPDDVVKVSPVEASAHYLQHLRDAWNHLVAKDDPTRRFEQQEILVTVPASFDAVARDLTVRAAQQAGIEHLTLLEEPQAAFYAWLSASGDDWRKQLTVGDVVLVCDVGGGTTDFSLISVGEQDGTLSLERVAVGDHILLGGDNMDLALAHLAKQRIEAEGAKLDAWQLASLVHSCRGAKEQLLDGSGKQSAPVVVLGRGSKVIGGSLTTELQRSDVEQLLVEGFFPEVELGEKPARRARTGLRELGLPFAADPAVTKHLSQFVSSHRKATAVLFNGGVMKSRSVQRRVTDVLDSWSDSPEDDLKVLSGTDLDLAVAHGAAYYGLVRRGQGIRIRGGTVRAYYIGIESSMPAIPGMAPPLRALCVAPFGMEEGTEADAASQSFGLVIGEPAEFRFLASSTRREDKAGQLLEAADDSMQELAPVATTLEAGPADSGTLVPVRLHSRVTEVGTLELWCQEEQGARRWKLEYDLRESA